MKNKTKWTVTDIIWSLIAIITWVAVIAIVLYSREHGVIGVIEDGKIVEFLGRTITY